MNSFISRVKRITNEIDRGDNKLMPIRSSQYCTGQYIIPDSTPISEYGNIIHQNSVETEDFYNFSVDNNSQIAETVNLSEDEMLPLVVDNTKQSIDIQSKDSPISSNITFPIGLGIRGDLNETETDGASADETDSESDDGLMEKLLFVERSIYTDKNCFAENCYESGKMSKLEYDVYCKWNNWLSDEFNVRPDAYIYLRCYPNVNYDRIEKRNRSGEENIPIEYLEILHDKHDKWMAKEKERIPVMTIDALQNFKDPEVMMKIVEDIYYFVKE